MLDQIPFGTNNFAENPEPRVPCVLLLDVSDSMSGPSIAELNAGLMAYKDELLSDSLASKRVEVAIVTFGSEVETAVDFTTADQFNPPMLRTSGLTSMGRAVNHAIDMVNERKQVYRNNGIMFFRPWIFLITDGEPTDGEAAFQEAARKLREGESQKAFAFFAVGVGGANFDKLRLLSPRDPLRLQGLQFRSLFQWLSNSQQSQSRSTPGEEVPLSDPTGPKGWAVI